MARPLPSAKRGKRAPSDYDPEVATEEAEKRNSAARNWTPPTPDEAAKLTRKWRRGPSNVGAMIRTNTYDPRIAVAREKIARLRKRKSESPA